AVEYERVRPVLGKLRKDLLDLMRSAGGDNMQLFSETVRSRPQVIQLRRAQWILGVLKNSDRPCLRQEFVEQLDPLGSQGAAGEAHTGRVPFGSAQARNEARFDGVSAGCKYNWNRRRGCPGRVHRDLSPACKQHSHLTSDQVGRECWEPVVVTSGPAIFYRHILAGNESGFFETLTKCNDVVRISVQRPGAEEPDYRQRRLLRERREAGTIVYVYDDPCLRELVAVQFDDNPVPLAYHVGDLRKSRRSS